MPRLPLDAANCVNFDGPPADRQKNFWHAIASFAAPDLASVVMDDRRFRISAPRALAVRADQARHKIGRDRTFAPMFSA
jgi:hypothetical protein